MSDDDIDVLIISTILGSMPEATDEAKAKLVVSYWRDTQRSKVTHPWRTFRRSPVLTQVAVLLVLGGFLGQVAVAVYILFTL